MQLLINFGIIVAFVIYSVSLYKRGVKNGIDEGRMQVLKENLIRAKSQEKIFNYK